MPSSFQDLREREFPNLGLQRHAYLDYTGGGLCSVSQLRDYSELIARSIVGNPHSHSPASMLGTSMLEEARRRVLRFFNASDSEYEAVFTQNATGAIKLVGESYPFRRASMFVLTSDNHNSVNGVREFAKRAKATTTYIPLDGSLGVSDLEGKLPDAKGSPSLFAYPAQSNFSGVQHPLDWIEVAHSAGYDVLLDAAAFVPTNQLDLGRVKPDFVPVSFYKMFGFPTGVGALIARRSSLEKLERPWFSGGTIEHVTTMRMSHSMAATASKFEDGTVNYLGVPGVKIGLDFLDRIGMEEIHRHVMTLTGELLGRLLELRHSNGSHLVEIYGPKTTEARGGTVALNVRGPRGEIVDFRLVTERAAKDNVSIRTGCFCNPGVGEYVFGYTPEREERCLHRLSGTLTPELFAECMGGHAKGAVRASLGVASNHMDIDRFVEVLRSFRDFSSAASREPLPALSC